MARNQEKQIAELNRFVIAKEKDQFKIRTRPPLFKLKTAEAIRRWIPDIKKDIDYCIQQIEGNRNYTEAKIREFRQRLDELQKEYEEFVAKAIELDGNPMWLPGNDHSYISKSVSKSIKEARENGDVMVNFNESEINSHTVTKKKASPLPEFLQPILAVKTNDIRNDKKCLVEESSSSESEEIETPLVDQSIHSESSDEEIATPLAISQKQKEEIIEDTKASHNFKSLQCTFNSNCVKYYSKSYYYLFKSNKSQTK